MFVYSMNIQEKIREEIEHFNTQLRTFYDERTTADNNDQNGVKVSELDK